MNPRSHDFAAGCGFSDPGSPLEFGQKKAIRLSRANHMTSADHASPVMTLAEAARKLRCSKAHMSNVVNGKVPHLPPLPVLRIGRRVLIRHEALVSWMRQAEQASSGCYDSARSGFIA